MRNDMKWDGCMGERLRKEFPPTALLALGDLFGAHHAGQVLRILHSIC